MKLSSMQLPKEDYMGNKYPSYKNTYLLLSIHRVFFLSMMSDGRLFSIMKIMKHMLI